MDPPSVTLTYPQLQNLLRVEFARARRYDYPLCCMAVQVDRLDHLRDLYGSKAREMILSKVLKVVQGQSRASDAVGWTGDRIVVVLPHTDVDGARVVADRIRRKVGELPFEVNDRHLEVTISLGLAAFTDPDTIFFDALLKDAEKALADAMQRGGNTLVLAQAAGDGAPTGGSL